MPAWILWQVLAKLKEPGGQHALWCANRHHRQPFVSSASDMGHTPSHDTRDLNQCMFGYAQGFFQSLLEYNFYLYPQNSISHIGLSSLCIQIYWDCIKIETIQMSLLLAEERGVLVEADQWRLGVKGVPRFLGALFGER